MRKKLVRARREAGFSQEKLAECIGVTRNTISLWERGIQDPHPIHMHRLCKLFDKSAEELDLGHVNDGTVLKEAIEIGGVTQERSAKNELFSHPNSEEEFLRYFSQSLTSDVMQAILGLGDQQILSLHPILGKRNMDKTRRIFLQIALASLAGQAGDTQFSINDALQNWGDKTFFEQQLASLWDTYQTGGTLQADSALKMLLATYEKRNFQKSASETLCMSYQLQGSIYRDMMKYDHAHFFYEQAFDVANELNDVELMAAALARRGVTYIQQHAAEKATSYLHKAQKFVMDHPFPYLSGYILQALSEAYAIAQQTAESDKYITLAQQVLDGCGVPIERSHCQANTTAVLAQKGVNAVHLQHYQSAITLLNQGIATYNPAFVRGQARLKAQLAEAYYGCGEIEACCQSATEAWIFARSASSNKTFTRLRKLHVALMTSPWKKDEKVIDFNWVMTTV